MEEENKNPSNFHTEIEEYGSGDRDYHPVRDKWSYDPSDIKKFREEISRRLNEIIVDEKTERKLKIKKIEK